MKRTLVVALATLFVGSFGFAPSVFASGTPTLSLSATGSGDDVQVTVTGTQNTSVLLSYSKAGYGLTIAAIGETDSNGNLSTVISSASYGLTSGTLVTAYLGGTGGAQSPSVAWPSVTSASSLTLSQNALVVDAGSSANVAETNGGSSLYVSSNSNPSVANVSINGTEVTVSGNIAGNTSVTLCPVGVSTNCPSVYVTVEQANEGQLSFSQNTASVVDGQNLPITITGGNGSYEITNNSDSSVIGASINGAVLTLSTGASSGSSSITVCSSDLSECGVVVASAGSTSSEAITFSNSAPIVSTGQSTTVSIYGPSGVAFYVSSNSNPSVVQANVSGSILALTGIANGTSSITICSSTNTCASLNATVQYVSTSATVTLSQNTLSLEPGQSATITVSGGQEPYTLLGGVSSVAQDTLSGNTLTIYGEAAGSFSMNVCSATGGCGPALSVSVSGSGTTGSFSMSQNSLSLTIGGSSVVSLYGSGSYYLSANTDSSIASVAVSGSSAVVAGLAAGSTDATICESGGSCETLTIVVTGTSTISTPTTITPAYTFTEYLAPGDQDAQVLALQELLVAQGDLSATPTGYYGTQTENAVLTFQADHGIDQLGVVGPATRAALNALESAGTSNTASASNTAISSMSLSQLQSEVQTLESELTQVLTRIGQLTGQ